jgi:hypothetical protein
MPLLYGQLLNRHLSPIERQLWKPITEVPTSYGGSGHQNTHAVWESLSTITSTSVESTRCWPRECFKR